MRTLTGLDVDTDALADTFERIADGLRSNDIGIETVETNHVARVDEDDFVRYSKVERGAGE